MEHPGTPPTQAPSGRTSVAHFAAAAVLVLTVLIVTQVYFWVNLWPVSITWTEAILVAIPQLLIWGLSFPVILWIADRWPVTHEAAASRLLLHLVLSFSVAYGALALLDLSDDLLHWTTYLGVPGALVSDWGLASQLDRTLLHLHVGVAIYWMVLAGRQTTGLYGQLQENRLRASETEAKLANARLDALRGQLQPHFLFNTLNSVAVLTRSDPQKAEEMLHRVSDLLRASLDTRAEPELSLAEELEVVQTYLEIERTRFADRLTVDVVVADEAADAMVPSFILQPLVENAIKHGIAPRAEGGHVQVDVGRSNGRLLLTVSDDGVGYAAATGTNGTGIGLRNTRERLETLFPGRHELSIRSPEGGGTTVRVAIPFRSRPSEVS